MADKKSESVTLKALKNIPLSMCVDSAKEIPERMKKHPGGARVERGTKVTVSKDVAKVLKSAGYAK